MFHIFEPSCRCVYRISSGPP